MAYDRRLIHSRASILYTLSRRVILPEVAFAIRLFSCLESPLLPERPQQAERRCKSELLARSCDRHS